MVKFRFIVVVVWSMDRGKKKVDDGRMDKGKEKVVESEYQPMRSKTEEEDACDWRDKVVIADDGNIIKVLPPVQNQGECDCCWAMTCNTTLTCDQTIRHKLPTTIWSIQHLIEYANPKWMTTDGDNCIAPNNNMVGATTNLMHGPEMG